MCTISYNSIGPIISDDYLIQNITRRHGSKPIIEPDTESKSSSFDLAWLGPLPDSNTNLLSLPKFTDFEYLGRLGDGAFAQVYCVQHIPSGKYLAIKVTDGKIEQARQQIEVERQILFRYSAKNPYMIRGYCTFHQGV
jgi:serine/threonine protein kinase